MLMPARSWSVLALACLLFVTGAPQAGAQSPAPSAAPTETRATQEHASVEHGYVLALPATWKLEPDPQGVADVRLVRTQGRRLSGSYQVFERAFWTTPQDWYMAARKRYQAVLGHSPAITRVEFRPLAEVTMGGLAAHCFEFTAELRGGGSITTRIAFIPRSAGKNTDVHELILTGEPGAFEEAQPEIRQIQDGLRWKACNP